MKALTLIVAVLVAGGCGTDTEPSAVSTEPGDALSEFEPEREPVGPDNPPAFVLESRAGPNGAAQGSYCVTETAAGTGKCVDAEALGEPESATLVRPGEEVAIRVEGVERAEGSMGVRRLGCPAEVASVPLAGPETAWTVDLEPGAYALDFSATFAAGTLSGDTSGVLGLVVHETHSPDIIGAPRPDRHCP